MRQYCHIWISGLWTIDTSQTFYLLFCFFFFSFYFVRLFVGTHTATAGYDLMSNNRLFLPESLRVGNYFHIFIEKCIFIDFTSNLCWKWIQNGKDSNILRITEVNFWNHNWISIGCELWSRRFEWFE